MIKALSLFFRSPLEEIGATLTLGPVAPQETLSHFLEAGGLQNALTSFSRRWENAHEQATATQWSKLYFSTLVPAALIPALAGGWQLPLAPETTGLQLGDDGGVSGFVLPHAGKVAPDPANLFAFLIEDHLQPLITALATASAIPAKVLWNNAGNIFETVLVQTATLVGPDHPGIQAGHGLLTARRMPDGRANPLFEPVRYRETATETKRIRRLCCLRYFTPALGFCKSCPYHESGRTKSLHSNGSVV